MKNIFVVAGIIMLIGIGFFLWQSRGSEPELSTSDTTTQEQTTSDSKFSGTLAELKDRGGNYMCTFSYDSEVALSTGTVYIAGARIRGDFQSRVKSVGGLLVETHMVLKDQLNYTWTSLSPTGFKSKITNEVNTPDGATQTQGQYTDLTQSYDYTCEPWSVDETKFNLPDISFIDVN